MPHVVAVTCPACRACAEFEFAEVRRIPLKRDIAYFENSKLFEYRRFRDSCGHDWHGAVHYFRLNGRLDSITDMPDGLDAQDWQHSRYLVRSQTFEWGTIDCFVCGHRAKHTLAWPAEAHYAIEYRGEVLWAFNRESAKELRDYVHSTDRDPRRYRWVSLLRHVPSTFLRKKARSAVVRRLDALLQG